MSCLLSIVYGLNLSVWGPILDVRIWKNKLFIMAIDTSHTGIQIKQKEPTKTFMMISNWKTNPLRQSPYVNYLRMEYLYRNSLQTMKMVQHQRTVSLMSGFEYRWCCVHCRQVSSPGDALRSPVAVPIVSDTYWVNTQSLFRPHSLSKNWRFEI